MPIPCANCNTLNSDTASFCKKCGTRLAVKSTTSVGGQVPGGPIAGGPPVGGSPIGGPPIGGPPIGGPIAGRSPAGMPPAGGPAAGPVITPVGPIPQASGGVLKLRPPKVRPGRPSRMNYWLLYLAVVLATALIGGISNINQYRGMNQDEAFLQGALIFGLIPLVLGLPIVLLLGKPSTMGIVTNLHAWNPAEHVGQPLKFVPTMQNWVFNLYLTDRNWQPLVDRKGFTLPMVEVEFRNDKVHGPMIEEGGKVILRGKWLKHTLRATEIWNCSPGLSPYIQENTIGLKGQVINIQARQAQDMRYPNQNRVLDIWTFELQQTDDYYRPLQDARGNLMDPIHVEIHAQSISGTLNNGNKVEVQGHWVRGTFNAVQVNNCSVNNGTPLIIKEWASIT